MRVRPPVAMDENHAIGCQKLAQQNEPRMHKRQVSLNPTAPLIPIGDRVIGSRVAGPGCMGCPEYGAYPKRGINIDTRNALRLLRYQMLQNAEIVAVNQARRRGWLSNTVMLTSDDHRQWWIGLDGAIATPWPSKTAVIGDAHESVDYNPDSIPSGGTVRWNGCSFSGPHGNQREEQRVYSYDDKGQGNIDKCASQS